MNNLGLVTAAVFLFFTLHAKGQYENDCSYLSNLMGGNAFTTDEAKQLAILVNNNNLAEIENDTATDLLFKRKVIENKLACLQGSVGTISYYEFDRTTVTESFLRIDTLVEKVRALEASYEIPFNNSKKEMNDLFREIKSGLRKSCKIKLKEYYALSLRDSNRDRIKLSWISQTKLAKNLEMTLFLFKPAGSDDYVLFLNIVEKLKAVESTKG